MLTQINPRIFRSGLRSGVIFFLRQAATKSFLREGRGRCADQPKKRNDADEHLAAKSILVRPDLQALRRREHRVENTINHKADHDRDQHDDHGRDQL